MCNGRRGQAMAEMVVAMIAIMMLLAGLFQITILSKANVENMMTARGEVDDIITGDTMGDSADKFILDWGVGPDGLRYTNDDIPDTSSIGDDLSKFDVELEEDLVEKPYIGRTLTDKMDDWRLSDRNEFEDAFEQNSFINASELRSSKGTPQSVPVEHVLQRLGVKKKAILLEDKVFMPKLKLLGEDPNG